MTTPKPRPVAPGDPGSRARLTDAVAGRGGVPADVWVHEHVEVHASPIAGCGLFATAPAAATVVMRLGGRIVSTNALRRLFDDAGNDVYIDTFAIGEDARLLLPEGTVAHFGNHCCTPTVWPVDALRLATCVDVDAGEALTITTA